MIPSFYLKQLGSGRLFVLLRGCLLLVNLFGMLAFGRFTSLVFPFFDRLLLYWVAADMLLSVIFGRIANANGRRMVLLCAVLF